MLGVKEVGSQAEKIFLRDKEINYCMACDSCQNNCGSCVQDDDVAEVLHKMIAADVIVMATPVYFYSMNGQMKTLIDRTYPRYTEITNKEIYIIVTAAVRSKQALKTIIEGFRGFISLLSRAEEKGIIYGTGAGIWETSRKAKQWIKHMKWERLCNWKVSNIIAQKLAPSPKKKNNRGGTHLTTQFLKMN